MNSLLPYLLISIISFIALTALICLKHFCFSNGEFKSVTKMLICVDAILLGLQIYLYVTSNYGMFLIGMAFQVVYVVIAALNVKK